MLDSLSARPRLLLFVATFILFVMSSRGYIANVDVQIRYQTAQQIWHHGTIFATKAQGENPETAGAYLKNEEGRYYSFYGIGQSIAMLPALLVADVVARLAPEERRESIRFLGAQAVYMSLVLPALSAFFLVGMFTLSRNLGIGVRQSCWSAIALGFGTYWWSYARTGLHNLELTGWLVWAVALYTTRPLKLHRAALASLAMGISFHYRQEILVPVLPMYLLMAAHLLKRTSWNLRALFHFTWPVTLMGVLVLIHNVTLTGSLTTPYDPESTGIQLWADHFCSYLLFVTTGVYKGIIWYAPVLLLAGILLLRRGRWDRSLTLGAVPVLLHLMFVASIERTYLDLAWGPRFLFPVLPFLVLALSYALTPVLERSHYVRWLAGSFVICCILAQCLLTVEFQETTHAQAVKAFANESGQANLADDQENVDLYLEGWRTSALVGALRNLGVPLGESRETLEKWWSPEVQALRTPTRQHLWWWKLTSGLSSRRSAVMFLIGSGVVLAGARLLHLTTFSCHPVTSPTREQHGSASVRRAQEQ